MANPKLTIEIGTGAVFIDAIGTDGNYVWQGCYRWDKYELGGMADRVLRDLPEWLREYAPTWVRQWDTAAAQA